MCCRHAALLLLVLLAAAGGHPAPLSSAEESVEGSGDQVMMSDAAAGQDEVMMSDAAAGQHEAPSLPGRLQSESVGAETMDELFQSLADLLNKADRQPETAASTTAATVVVPAQLTDPTLTGQQPEPEPAPTATAETVVVPVRLTGVTVVDPTPPGRQEEHGAAPDLGDLGDLADHPEQTSAGAGASPEENEVPLPAVERHPAVESIIVAETAHCLGCVTPILHDGAYLRRVANMAAKLLEDKLDSRYTFRVTEVYRASKQVVNGIKFFLTLELASTSCERPVPAFTLCYVDEDAERVIYAVEMLHQPHRANTELLLYRKVEPAEVLALAGLFAAATASPPTDAPPATAAPIEPGDSLLDILMGLDAVIMKQRSRQPAAEPAELPPLPAAPPLQRHATSAEAQHVMQLLGGAAVRQADGQTTSGSAGCRAGRDFDSLEVPLNVAHPRVQKILHDFLDSQERSRSQRLVITDVRSATSQTIAEINYRFEFVLGVSQCAKNTTAHRYSCSALGNHPLSNCRVRARQRPGHPLQFNSVSCTTQRQPECANGQCDERQIHPYGPAYLKYPESTEDVNVHDPAYQQLVRHVQDEVNRRSRRPYLKKFVKTLNATKVTYDLQETSEIVEQELYSLTLRFVDTQCDRSAEAAACLARADPTDGAATSMCDVRVSSLSWADRMRVLDMFCETEAPRSARGV